MNIKQEREALIKSSMDLIAKAESRGSFTAEQRATLKSNERRIAEIDAEKDGQQVREDQALLGQIRSSFKASEGAGLDGEKHLAVRPGGVKATAQALASTFEGKSLIGSGTATATIVAAPELAAMATLPTTLLEVLPVRAVSSPTFRFLRGTARDMQAATVAPGETKPTSTLGLTPVDERLRVVAHLSEPVDVYALADIPMLRSFLQDQLQRGLYEAVEHQVIAGDGVGENLTGIAGQSGLQTQAFEGDVLTTVRRALLASETLGYNPNVVVMNPTTWASVEMATTEGSGAYHLESSPVNAAERRIWGKRVVTSTRLPADAGFVLDTSQLTVYTDTQGVQARWSESHEDDFATNAARLRVEGRFALAVHQAAAHVQFATV